MVHIRPTRLRRGTATVELAFMMPFLLLMIVGVWELGRLIQMQQVMYNAARAGARIASQANIVNTTGAFTQIAVSSGSPSVQEAIVQNLKGAGITNLTGLQITFQYLNGDTSLTDPYQGSKNQQFSVTISMPYSNVSWTSLGLINPTSIGATCIWQIMVDDPFSVSTTLPTWNPINN